MYTVQRKTDNAIASPDNNPQRVNITASLTIHATFFIIR